MSRLLAIVAVLSLVGCSTAQAPAPAPEVVTPEIPITSKSPEAIEFFKKGRDLADNIRFAEAAAAFGQALKADPDFALAIAYNGIVTPGPRGLSYLEQASTKASATPAPGSKAQPVSKAERLFIEASLAGRRGEFAKSEDLWKQTTEAAPNDWRALIGRGGQLSADEKYSEAIETLNRALAINDKSGPTYNTLAYAYLAQGDTAPAIEALKRYVALSPNEPNPHDSLGEALMASGDLPGAEAEFKQASTISPNFHIAQEGVAYTKFFRGDWAGGAEALTAARTAAMRPADRLQVDLVSGFALLGQGKTPDGLKQLNGLLKSPDASTVNQAFVPVYRAMVAIDGAKYADALKESDNAMALGTEGKLPIDASGDLRRLALTTRAAAEGLSGDAAGIDKTVETLQKEATARPDDPQLRSAVHFGLGMQAVAKKDMKAAAAHFEQCARNDSYCQLGAFTASRKANDRAGADAARARLARNYIRDPIYLYARSKVK
ncbi:MAG: tetratricopeptide repeat protein [Vicinamibacterales bacterium]|nr:tetratricopeptide repeat protein [Vicinamibacterales bacterium]